MQQPGRVLFRPVPFGMALTMTDVLRAFPYAQCIGIRPTKQYMADEATI